MYFRWFGLIQGTVGTVLSYAMLVYFYMPWLWDKSVRILESMGLDASHEIKATIIFFLLDSAKDLVLGLPWSLYSTFHIEEKHGFNKQTLGLFFMDMFKQVEACMQSRHVMHYFAPVACCLACQLNCMQASAYQRHIHRHWQSSG